MEKPSLNVLLIEDNPGDARLVDEMLRTVKGATVQLEATDRLSEGLHRLDHDGLDAVLLDLSLPDSQGLDTFLRARAHALDLPIVVLTGTDDEALALQAVEIGAQDYLVKGRVDGDSLLRSIRYSVRRQQLLADLERVAAELVSKNRDLDAFAHTISHDLKEPSRAVEAFSQFLLEDYAGCLDEQGREYLSRLARAGARLKEMIDDLLTLSQISRQSSPPMTVALGPVVAAIESDLQQTIEERNAVIGAQEEMPSVTGDPLRINQIFHNLIDNALKFNDSSQPQVMIGVRAQEKGMATLFVADNGIGIDPEYHGRIFGPFERLHRREEYGGTGAGLAIVQRAVEASGGRVWVESRLGAGSTFLFTLPAAEVQAVPRELNAA